MSKDKKNFWDVEFCTGDGGDERPTAECDVPGTVAKALSDTESAKRLAIQIVGQTLNLVLTDRFINAMLARYSPRNFVALWMGFVEAWVDIFAESFADCASLETKSAGLEEFEEAVELSKIFDPLDEGEGGVEA